MATTMTLDAGKRLGPYEILSLLGAGGMGEVYRAKDKRLGRTVAIKILLSHRSDEVLRQRFEREARAISSLNHPNICVLHDVGRQDGIDYLVMELLEGETLAQRLAKGALPLAEVLRIGVQVADALCSAHGRGIVHRDLKPGNIMLTPSGAKVLDFGLAKAAAPLIGGTTLTTPISPATPVTQEGTVLGTLHYMSPEQVEGNEVDARSDIFAFGAVLYEMMTGQRAFPGKTPLSVASAVVSKDPAPPRTLQPLTPLALDRVIRVCLAKDPGDRWQTARDLLRELQWIAEAASQPEPAGPTVAQRTALGRIVTLAAAVLAIAAVIAGVGWWRALRNVPPRLSMRFNVETTPGSFIDRFAGAQLALSPDGTRIVVAECNATTGTWHLAVRRMDQAQFTPIPGTDNALTPFFSPDGQWIAFFADNKLKKIAVQGGTPQTLCDAPKLTYGGSWGDDGNIVAAFNQGSAGLVRMLAGGGAATPITRVSKEKTEGGHAWPQVLPGSHAVLFCDYRPDSYVDGNVEGDIVVVLPKTGDRKLIHKGGYFARYLRSGHLVYMQGHTLWAAPFDLDRLALTAEPEPVLEEVNGGYLEGGDFASSTTGTLVYVGSHVERSFPYSIWWLDSAGHTSPVHVTPGLYENPRLSPDGKRLAFEVATAGVRSDIWMKDLDRDTLSRLTHLPGRNNWPVWSADGSSLFFGSDFQPAPGLYCVRADGARDAQRVLDHTLLYPHSASQDGRYLTYSQSAEDFSHSEIVIASIEGDREHPRVESTGPVPPGHEFYSVFSPDGHWLAYGSYESGTAELYVRPFPGPGGKTQVSTGGGGLPIWSRTEHKLFFLTPDWHIMVASYTANAGVFTAGKPEMWSDKSLAYLGGCYPYDLAPDGKRFVVVLNPGRGGEQEWKPTDNIMVVLNFFDELRNKLRPGRN